MRARRPSEAGHSATADEHQRAFHDSASVTTDSRTPPATPDTLTVTENGAPTPARYLGAGGTFRLEPPRLRTTADPHEQRHATWFELFFDLVFVAAVSQLGARAGAGSLGRRLRPLRGAVCGGGLGMGSLHALRQPLRHRRPDLPPREVGRDAGDRGDRGEPPPSDGRSGRNSRVRRRIRRAALAADRLIRPRPAPRRRPGPQARRNLHRRLLGHDRTLAHVDLRTQSSSLRAVDRGDGHRPRDPHARVGRAQANIPSLSRTSPSASARSSSSCSANPWSRWWLGWLGSSSRSNPGSSPASAS